MKTILLKVRLCIYPKDIVEIVGCSEGYARRIIRNIKAAHGKQPHQKVTTAEFAQHMGFSEEDVIKRLS